MMPNGAIVHAGNRLERLADELAGLLREPLPGLLQPETIVVQSRGMQRWLSLELAQRNGICTNAHFPFPNAVLDELTRIQFGDSVAVGGFEAPWLTLRIAALLPELSGEPGFAPIAAYRQADADGLKTLQLAERIAHCFDQYQVFRPELVLGWEAGQESDWQAELWRRLCADAQRRSRARGYRDLIHALQRRQAPVGAWPARLTLFGISYLPPLYLEAFAALARHTAVHLFLLSPCREFWADLLTRRETGRLLHGRPSGASPEKWLHLEAGHRLLASLGEQGRDFFRLLSASDALWLEHYEAPGESHLLACLQSDMLELRARRAGERPLGFDPLQDRSIQVHACHSPLREVEVLHQQLLALFEANPDLTAGDVLVMVPEIERYAPLVQAVFETPESEALRIPFTVADRGWRAQSPTLEGFFALLRLPEGRLEASQVLDLLQVPAICQRFGLEPADLGLIARWVHAVQIRWGLDGASKRRLGLPAFEPNTWRAGIARLLLGVALPPEGLFAGVLPSDAVSGSQTQTLGALLDYLEALFAAVESLGVPRSIAAWGALLRSMLDDLFTISDAESRMALEHLRSALAELEQAAQQAGLLQPLELAAVRYWLERRTAQGATGGGFLAGAVTVCALVPMRSLPAAVICLLGMDDAGFPRQHSAPSFDRMAREPRPGDRNQRRDDKYLFLEALLAARRVFYVSYVGQALQDNASLPPSVPVSELLDTLCEGFDDGGGRLRAQIETRHPLHAVSPRYFSGDGALRSYSPEDFAAAQASLAPPKQRIFLDTALEGIAAEDVVALADLERFLANPARALLRNTLGVRFALPRKIPADRENLSLDSLERFDLHRRVLERMIRPEGAQAAVEMLRAEGRLPPGSLGEAALERLQAQADGMLARMRRWSAELVPQERALSLELHRQTVVGRLTLWPPAGVIRMHPGRLRAFDLLSLWVQHLALHALVEDEPVPASRLLTRQESCRFGLVPEWRLHLESLLAFYRQGLQRPWPFFPEASLAYAERRLVGDGDAHAALLAARRCYDNDGTFGVTGESYDPYVQRLFGGEQSLGEAFASAAEAVYAPLLTALTREPHD